jgi:hypothetical protein
MPRLCVWLPHVSLLHVGPVPATTSLLRASGPVCFPLWWVGPSSQAKPSSPNKFSLRALVVKIRSAVQLNRARIHRSPSPTRPTDGWGWPLAGPLPSFTGAPPTWRVRSGRRDPWGADPLQSWGELTTHSLRIKEERSWPWNSPPWSTRSKAARSPMVCRGHWRERVSAGNQQGRSAAALEERERGSSSDYVERRSRRQGLPERFANERRSSSGYWVCFLWSPWFAAGQLQAELVAVAVGSYPGWRSDLRRRARDYRCAANLEVTPRSKVMGGLVRICSAVWCGGYGSAIWRGQPCRRLHSR